MKIVFEPFELDEDTQTLTLRGQTVRVQPKVLQLLSLFLHSRGRRLPADEIAAELWPGDPYDQWHSSQVSRLVARLREALQSGDRQFWIQTTSPPGYRFVLETPAEVISQSRSKPLIFLSYAREDFDFASQIYHLLHSEGYRVWWDHLSVLPGQDWEFEVETAIQDANLCSVVLSRNSVSKIGYVNKEIKRILDRLDTMPSGKVFIIPLQLDDCIIPQRLKQWQALDCSQTEWQSRLTMAVECAL